MAKTYSELEAWGIFAGALMIGIVVTSMFWAYITKPEDVKKLEEVLGNATLQNASLSEMPSKFLLFCDELNGVSIWDSSGFRQCILEDYSGQNLIKMNLLCKQFNLTLSYGSYGVKCEGTV